MAFEGRFSDFYAIGNLWKYDCLCRLIVQCVLVRLKKTLKEATSWDQLTLAAAALFFSACPLVFSRIRCQRVPVEPKGLCL